MDFLIEIDDICFILIISDFGHNSFYININAFMSTHPHHGFIQISFERIFQTVSFFFRYLSTVKYGFAEYASKCNILLHQTPFPNLNHVVGLGITHMIGRHYRRIKIMTNFTVNVKDKLLFINSKRNSSLISKVQQNF